MAQYFPAGVGVSGHDGHLGPVDQERTQIHLVPIHGGHDSRFGQAGADQFSELAGRRPLGELPLRTVGKPYRNDA
jgi:hypothetical protein